MNERLGSLKRGDVIWVAPDPVVGSEQQGRRPAVVVSSDSYLMRVARLAVILPVTTRDRGWPLHVPLRGAQTGLTGPSFALTEQIRTIDRQRIERRVGQVDQETLSDIDAWLRDNLGLGA